MAVGDGLARLGMTESMIRSRCRGVLPLDSRLQPWMTKLAGQSEVIRSILSTHGSPAHVLDCQTMRDNIDRLRSVIDGSGIGMSPHFAVKSNAHAGFVDTAIDGGLGLDVASEGELTTCLTRLEQRRIPPKNRAIVCTAAVKPDSLLRRCVIENVTVVIDNPDEWTALCGIAEDLGRHVDVLTRMGRFGDRVKLTPSRFGMDATEIRTLVSGAPRQNMVVRGLHFHLDAAHDVSVTAAAIQDGVDVIQTLREAGCPADVIDVGGGWPVGYAISQSQVDKFWRELDQAVLGRRSPITFGNHGLGRFAIGDQVSGRRNAYPAWQPMDATTWLSEILTHHVVIDAARNGIRFWCEPGRSLVDGCGVTLADVLFVKRGWGDDVWVGLAMNGSQCRTTMDDFLVDPLVIGSQLIGSDLIGNHTGDAPSNQPATGLFVGGYCTEVDVILKRRFEFPHGIRRGDVVMIPNTAGYQMHFAESTGHQFAPAANVPLESERTTSATPRPGRRRRRS